MGEGGSVGGKVSCSLRARTMCGPTRVRIWQEEHAVPLRRCEEFSAADESLLKHRPAHGLLSFQIGGMSSETGVQICSSKSLRPTPPPPPPLLPVGQPQKQQDTDLSRIVHRAEFGRIQIRGSQRLVMIRGSGPVMGSEDDRLFPSLQTQTGRGSTGEMGGGGGALSAKPKIMGDNS